MTDFKKTERIGNLLELYRNLLTKKQQEVMDMYFLYDLSITEISENCGISRAAIFDMLKRTEKILEDYESKLSLYEKRNKIEKLIENIDENIKKDIEELI